MLIIRQWKVVAVAQGKHHQLSIGQLRQLECGENQATEFFNANMPTEQMDIEF